MEITLKMNFWFEGIEDCTDQEVKDYLLAMIDYGKESTCSEVENLLISNQNGTL